MDVDLLVDPIHFTVIRETFERLQWHGTDLEPQARGIPPHSLALRHPGWPCEIDLHWRFPGFFLDAQEVFEYLWGRRDTATIAHTLVPVPDRPSQAVIVATHALRSPTAHTSRADLDFLASRFNGQSSERKAAFSAVACAVGADLPLRPFLQRLGVALARPSQLNPVDWETWQVHTGVGHALGVSWLLELKRASLREWPRILARALWIPEEVLRTRMPSTGPRRRDVLAARFQRMRQAVRSLPRSVALVWRRR